MLTTHYVARYNPTSEATLYHASSKKKSIAQKRHSE